jgi:hypothetical protein
MGLGVVEAGKVSFHYPNFSSFPAFNQEKLGLAAKAFVLMKALASRFDLSVKFCLQGL